jgi:hypothetical protein
MRIAVHRKYACLFAQGYSHEFPPRHPAPGFTILENISSFSYNEYIVFIIGEKEYYERQLTTMQSFAEVDALMAPNSNEVERDAEEAYQEKLMKISNYANVVLLALKVM